MTCAWLLTLVLTLPVAPTPGIAPSSSGARSWSIHQEAPERLASPADRSTPIPRPLGDTTLSATEEEDGADDYLDVASSVSSPRDLRARASAPRDLLSRSLDRGPEPHAPRGPPAVPAGA